MLLYLIGNRYPCRNHQECAEQARRFREQMVAAQQIGRRQLHLLLNNTPHSITASDQTVELIATAGFSYREVVGVVRQGGSPGHLIEWIEGATGRGDIPIDEYTSTILLIRGTVAGSNGVRPIHVACGFKQRPRPGRCWDLRILLAYDPSGSAYHGKWNSDYSFRTCFCPPEGVEEFTPDGRRERLHISTSSTRVVYTTKVSR